MYGLLLNKFTLNGKRGISNKNGKTILMVEYNRGLRYA